MVYKEVEADAEIQCKSSYCADTGSEQLVLSISLVSRGASSPERTTARSVRSPSSPLHSRSSLQDTVLLNSLTRNFSAESQVS